MLTEVITPDEIAKKKGQTEAGRLWDVLWMCSVAARCSKGQAEIRFKLEVVKGKCREFVKLKALCHPGDKEEPVITIMLPDED
ncbi:hypothetical protein Dred_0987 [Desulforamulus reducens MI-1]|uniref:Uncharacterized protein n=1 Tax=Desulforamulus reducens (strain ATCC BAA-1160 / DSM 100696 / MI-1) TaxID=349161 RepID=A4J369_DESRM|nr:hypothetical protein Dred_0987 [Desulforamulus reducens MI-1]